MACRAGLKPQRPFILPGKVDCYQAGLAVGDLRFGHLRGASVAGMAAIDYNLDSPIAALLPLNVVARRLDALQ